MTEPLLRSAPPLELVLAGKASLHRGRIAYDLRARIVDVAPSAIMRDRSAVLAECGGDRLLAETCLTGMALCQAWIAKRPGAGDQDLHDALVILWESLHRTEADWRDAGIWTPAGVNAAGRAALHDAISLYLSMGGYVEATRSLTETIWAFVRAGSEHSDALVKRAAGLTLLDYGTDGTAALVVLTEADPLVCAQIHAEAHLRPTAEAAQGRGTHADAIEDVRAGLARLAASAPEAEPEAMQDGPGVVIFPHTILGAQATAEGKRDVKTALGAALGKRLSLTPVPEDWNAWEAGRLAASPWGGAAFRAIREGQAGRTHLGRDVICVVGPAGAGKSYLVREAAESLGVPFARFGADAASENSFAGTGARWATKHLSFVESAQARFEHAGPMILVDELEKAAGSRQSNGGKLHDCLHGMWEPETCAAWHSVFLLHPVSLAHVPFVCTANSLDGLPASLIDRMRIVHVPEPGPEHLGVLAPRIARAACRELGQDERFGTLDADEMAALSAAWSGGSIRRLRRLVETVLRARESGPAAMPRH